jgi:hypothetical protein
LEDFFTKMHQVVMDAQLPNVHMWCASNSIINICKFLSFKIVIHSRRSVLEDRELRFSISSFNIDVSDYITFRLGFRKEYVKIIQIKKLKMKLTFSQDVKKLVGREMIFSIPYQLKLKILPIYLIKINYFGCWIVKIRRS